MRPCDIDRYKNNAGKMVEKILCKYTMAVEAYAFH